MRDTNLSKDYCEYMDRVHPEDDDRTVLVCHSETATIHGAENEHIAVNFDIEDEGSELRISQEGSVILLGLYEAEALRDVLNIYLDKVEM